MSLRAGLRFAFAFSFIVLFASCSFAARLEPTKKDVHYGTHERDVLDFWKAKSDKPTPLVIYIHGGGFIQGDKGAASDADIKKCLSNGVSYMSISYPYFTDTMLLDIIRGNIARAVQFARFKSAEWNVDKAKIAVYGESAGAGSSLWLAFHDDIADKASADPVLRESSRVAAAGALNTQATYDLPAWEKLLSGYVASGTIKTFRLIMAKTVLDMYHQKNERAVRSKEFAPTLHDLDMLSMIDKADPPVYMRTMQSGLNDGDLLHNSRHAKAVKETCDSRGASCVLIADETPVDKRVDVIDFLLEQFKKR